MKPQLSFSFSNDLYENTRKYLCFIPPNQRIVARTNKEKLEVSGICKGQGMYNPAHLTTVSFYATTELEPLLIASIQSVCNKHEQFMVHLQDYFGFETGNNSTVYIGIKEHQSILELVNDLRVIDVILKSNGHRKATFTDTPHLTLARGLLHSSYVDAMNFLKDKSFNDAFIVNNLMLIKKRVGDKASQPVATFQLPFPQRLIN